MPIRRERRRIRNVSGPIARPARGAGRARLGLCGNSHSHWLAASLIVVGVGAWFSGAPDASIDTGRPSLAAAALASQVPLPFEIENDLVENDFDLEAFGARRESRWIVVDIRKGDTLSRIFRKYGVPARLTHTLSRSIQGRLLNRLRIGPNLRLHLGPGDELLSLRYDVDTYKVLVARFHGLDFETRLERRRIEVRQREVTGTIETSLFDAASRAGLSDAAVARLESIFQWNIDFNRDLRSGDRFSVIFEDKFVAGRQIGTGVVAASFTVGDLQHTAFRHVDEDGRVEYYSEDGESLKRAFLRSPVAYARISSKFSNRRYHPVLKEWRAHRGVDYAAPRNTPVMATADGVVHRKGRDGAYGRLIVLRHGVTYRTVYAHLNRFAKNLKVGARVKQGQVIGFVGSSGLSTGPHLHYEFRVNGRHEDPLTVKTPSARSIAEPQRDEFLKLAANLNTRLNSLSE